MKEFMFRFYVSYLSLANSDNLCVADVSARAFYENILVTDFIAKHYNFNFSRPLSDQDRIKVFIFESTMLF